MNGKIKKWSLIAFAGILILLSFSSCFIFGGQTIYEDPEHVDFNGEDSDGPEMEAHDEDADGSAANSDHGANAANAEIR